VKDQNTLFAIAICLNSIELEQRNQIMNAFVEMRKFIAGNSALLQRLDNVERKLLATDEQFERIFHALESH
jgi:hypothetical protein